MGDIVRGTGSSTRHSAHIFLACAWNSGLAARAHGEEQVWGLPSTSLLSHCRGPGIVVDRQCINTYLSFRIVGTYYVQGTYSVVTWKSYANTVNHNIQQAGLDVLRGICAEWEHKGRAPPDENHQKRLQSRGSTNE